METTHPTPDERFFFDTNGYLILEGLLPDGLVSDLTQALTGAIERRRLAEERGDPLGESKFTGRNARIFGLLEEDPAFLYLMDYAPVMPYVRGLLHPEPNYHASDAIWEVEDPGGGAHWHRDGRDGGYGLLGPQVPHLQIKIGYFLSDMSRSDQGNLTIVPGSHHAVESPTREQRAGYDSMPGATQISGPAGTCVMFHNALWHTPGRWGDAGGERITLYYAYEHPWMMAAYQARYSRSFYHSLSDERKRLFHEVVFEVG